MPAKLLHFLYQDIISLLQGQRHKIFTLLAGMKMEQKDLEKCCLEIVSNSFGLEMYVKGVLKYPN